MASLFLMKTWAGRKLFRQISFHLETLVSRNNLGQLSKKIYLLSREGKPTKQTIISQSIDLLFQALLAELYVVCWFCGRLWSFQGILVGSLKVTVCWAVIFIGPARMFLLSYNLCLIAPVDLWQNCQAQPKPQLQLWPRLALIFISPPTHHP